MSNDILGNMNSYRKYSIILCCISLQLALYSVQVTMSKRKDPNYTAICDISEKFSCSEVFASNFGTGFGIVDKIFDKTSVLNQPNGVYGIFLYPGIILCSILSWPILSKLQLLLTAFGFAASTYGFINTFFISSHICAVCITGHTINYILFVLAILNYFSDQTTSTKTGSKSKKSK